MNRKRLYQGWTQTSFYLQLIHFTSHHTISHVFWAYLYSTGTHLENLPLAGWPILFCGLTQLVSQLAGALSPDKHKGLHQGWTQTSLYLKVIHFTSHHTTSRVFFSLFIFRGHSTREPASSMATYFILRIYTGTMCQPQPTQEKSGEVLEKCRWMDRNGRNKQGGISWQ